MQPAGLQACQECPWRKENRGREHPDRTPYTDEWLTGIWRDIANDGGTFSCHLFDAGVVHYSDEVKAAGFKEPADIGGSKECAGMVAMVKRELELVLTSPSYTQYRDERPAGLSEEAISYFLARVKGEVGPTFRMSEYMDMADILDMHDVVDTDSMTWKYSAAFASDLNGLISTLLPELRTCECVVCTDHHKVHDMLPLTTAEGLDVSVDAELHPLLFELAKAGIRTTASCIDIHAAVKTLAPTWIDPLMNADVPGKLNYQTALRKQAAFIELRNDQATEKLFLAGSRLLAGIEVSDGNARSQIVFTRTFVPTLTAIARHSAEFHKRETEEKKAAAKTPVKAASKQDLAKQLLARRLKGTA